MIRIAVVEDYPNDQRRLLDYLRRCEKERGDEFQVTTFSSGHEIAYKYSANFDIIFMDIEMGAVSGMEAAELIRSLDKEVAILFITNLPQYAIRGYEVEALDYILKPISYYAFSQRLGRAIERLERRSRQYIRINLGWGQVKKLDLAAIYYVEVQQHSLVYHTMEGDFTVSGAMRDIEAQLAGKWFFRCNKGFLVNLKHIDSFRKDCVIVNGEQVQISRAKKKPLMDAFNNYINEVEQ